MDPSSPQLVDSHAHLDSGQFAADRDAVIERAVAAGISDILTIGCDLESSRQSIALAESYPRVHAAVGVHPHDAGEIDDRALEELEAMLAHPQVVALGEIGLDYYRNRAPRDVQLNAFRRQLRLATKLGKPVIIHDRDAHADVLRLLQEEDTPCGGVLHCFSGDLQMARTCLEMGFYLSFPGVISYPKNTALREIVAALPIDRLLVETDCPYLAPQPYRGKRNEPAYVRLTAEKLAEIKNLSFADVARITSRNCHTLFGIGSLEAEGRIAYRIRDALYLNITNRCSNHCVFCAKFTDCVVKGHSLKLAEEPALDDLKSAIRAFSGYREVVFCGYGEPLLRLDLVKDLADWLHHRGVRVRINTDGQANLVHRRNVLPELRGLIDALSVSLNASDGEEYQRLCRSPYGTAAYPAVKEFIRLAKAEIPEVTATAVTYPGVDIEACRQVAEQLGVPFRARDYQPPLG